MHQPNFVDTRLKRLMWRMRRGMLENDLMFTHFLQTSRDVFQDASKVDALEQVLALDDQTLFNLLIRQSQVEDCFVEPSTVLSELIERLQRSLPGFNANL